MPVDFGDAARGAMLITWLHIECFVKLTALHHAPRKFQGLCAQGHVNLGCRVPKAVYIISPCGQGLVNLRSFALHSMQTPVKKSMGLFEYATKTKGDRKYFRSPTVLYFFAAFVSGPSIFQWFPTADSHFDDQSNF